MVTAERPDHSITSKLSFFMLCQPITNNKTLTTAVRPRFPSFELLGPIQVRPYRATATRPQAQVNEEEGNEMNETGPGNPNLQVPAQTQAIALRH